uniref:Uncharacterized protein n=1 Tax=Klebsiella pneumoniae TaxID=573 RepID=A0A8B0SXA3_KLEPN|nr:hypothetical protein [Klebsiella pneumoniae]
MSLSPSKKVTFDDLCPKKINETCIVCNHLHCSYLLQKLSKKIMIPGIPLKKIFLHINTEIRLSEPLPQKNHV